MSKVIDDYVLYEKIGQGQYGNVYRAQNKKNKQNYAIKAMNVDKFKQTPKLNEFTNNEINILSKINHVNIIKFIQVLRTTNNYYLVYQYCNGGTLSQHIKSKGKLSQDDALKIFEQLRNAFEVLHSENILHRDLKPTNILFHNGVIKIADFGFCKELVKQTDMAQTMVGSPIYMAPEVLKGLIYDSRADIWSLGVILYQMLYGSCPYQQSSIPKLISLIDNNMLKFPQDFRVSENTKLLIKRTLTIKYRQRISPIQFLKFPLETKSSFRKRELDLQYNFKEVTKFLRSNALYLSQTIQLLANLCDNPSCLQLAFLVYKIFATFLKDTNKSSSYWQNIKINNTQELWQIIYQGQMDITRTFVEMIKQALYQTNLSLKTKLELQTTYIDCKYYLEIVQTISDSNLKMKLLNCMLINKHFINVLEKKKPDFTNYIEGEQSLVQKEQICHVFAKMY